MIQGSSGIRFLSIEIVGEILLGLSKTLFLLLLLLLARGWAVTKKTTGHHTPLLYTVWSIYNTICFVLYILNKVKPSYCSQLGSLFFSDLFMHSNTLLLPAVSYVYMSFNDATEHFSWTPSMFFSCNQWVFPYCSSNNFLPSNFPAVPTPLRLQLAPFHPHPCLFMHR